MLSPSTLLRTRAWSGAGYLDDVRPGWWRKINLERLNLNSSCNCILGQLAGDYQAGLRELGIEVTADALALGFNLLSTAPSSPEWDALNEAWCLEVLERRAEARL